MSITALQSESVIQTPHTPLTQANPIQSNPKPNQRTRLQEPPLLEIARGRAAGRGGALRGGRQDLSLCFRWMHKSNEKASLANQPYPSRLGI